MYVYDVDMWSAGVIFLEMLIGTCPFNEATTERDYTADFQRFWDALYSSRVVEGLSPWGEYTQSVHLPAVDSLASLPSRSHFAITTEEIDL